MTASSPATAPGDIFAAPYDGPGQSGPMILESDGGLVWFKALPKYTSATNLRVQEYAGKPVLTWWQGDISIHGFGQGEGVILDGAYAPIARVRAGNGLQADLHEFQLTPQGTALITAYDPIHCDLASVGGPADGAVTDGTFQEIDVRTGLVMFQWTSLDHVALAESYAPANISDTAFPFDYFHINSINLDQDGSLLISSRNTWTAYDLNPQTGQIDWQLGGKHSSFTMGPGTTTAWQHDPRELANGSFSIFDNGASPTVHSQSRGIVVGLEPQAQDGDARQRTHPHAADLRRRARATCRRSPTATGSSAGGKSPTSPSSAPPARCYSTRTSPPAISPTATCASPGPASPRPARRSPARRSRCGCGHERGDRLRELERRHARRELAGARGRHRAQPQAGRAGPAERLRDGDRAARGDAGRYLTVQALGATGQVLGAAATVAAQGL